MVGLMNFDPNGGFDPTTLSLGLMALGNSLNRPRRYTTSISEATAPDDSGFQQTLGLMQYANQNRANQQRLAMEQERLGLAKQQDARAGRLSDLQFGDAQQASLAKQEFQAAMQSGDPVRIAAARAKFDPAGTYQQQYGWQKPQGQIDQEQASDRFKSGLAVQQAQQGRVMTPEEYKQKLDLARAQSDIAQTGDIKEFQFAQKNGFTGNFQDWMKTKRSVTGEFGMTPIYGVGPDGKPAIMQLGKDGKPVQVPLPKGFQISKNPEKVDLGTHWGFVDPQTRQLVSTMSKDVEGAAKAKAIGTEAGQAQAALPSAEGNLQTAINSVDELLKHPGRESATGTFYGRIPEAVLSGDAKAFVNRFNQVKGQTFLNAYETLRGGGAITEVEGQKATAAKNRMDRATDAKEFEAAAKDYKDALSRGLEALRKKAGQGAAPGNTRLKYNPVTGELE